MPLKKKLAIKPRPFVFNDDPPNVAPPMADPAPFKYQYLWQPKPRFYDPPMDDEARLTVPADDGSDEVNE